MARCTGKYLAVMRHIETLEDVRAVVVTGTPPAFSVGGDSQALGDHAERGSYDTGLANDVVRPGGTLRQEFDEWINANNKDLDEEIISLAYIGEGGEYDI